MNNDLIERLRLLERDHEPDGWPAVRMRDITALLDALEAARADAAEAALAEYANPKNWGDYEGRQRVWIEPDSSTPDAYNGYALAQAAIAAQQAEGES